MTKRTGLIVIDDHPLYRDGVVRTLEDSDFFDVLGTGADKDAALRLAENFRPDMALLDISMPGGGLAALAELSQSQPEIKIVMLTVSERDSDVLGALSSGASGYVLKGVGGTELVEIVRSIAQGGSYVSPALAARVLSGVQDGDKAGARPALERLTGREEQILRLVARGQSNKEVALALDLQEKTIKHHMTSILSKLDVRNRVEAAVLARQVWDQRD